ncbi:hypothetical protein FRB99_004632 [Tulasnella sp. 403]|nr:hypothetical protein FRB99_004632 [Tulasnella sp. 403]
MAYGRPHDAHRSENGPLKRAKYTHDYGRVGSTGGDSSDPAQEVKLIQASLSDADPDNVTSALHSIRVRLTPPELDDSATRATRLALVEALLQSSKGIENVFYAWEWNVQDDGAMANGVMALLATILSVLEAHPDPHALGDPIIRKILSDNYLSRLSSYLTPKRPRLAVSALVLFKTMATFGSGYLKKEVSDAFPWKSHVVAQLINVRRAANQNQADPFRDPDVRTAFIAFVLSFITTDTPTSVKMSLMERQGIFTDLTEGLKVDPYPVVRRVLEACWDGIMQDSRIPYDLKLRQFNNTTLRNIARLYRRADINEATSESPADVAHRFFMSMCTTPGVGICFRSRGWYPPSESATNRSDANGVESRSLYNGPLAAFFTCLHPEDDHRQQELVLKILEACPELISRLFNHSHLHLQPRLSSRWIINIGLFNKIISLPILTSCFHQEDGQYVPQPPPIATIVDSFFPSTWASQVETGFSCPSALVRHLTATALTRSLRRCAEILDIMDEAYKTLDEDRNNGPWASGKRELLAEVSNRMPPFSSIVSAIRRDQNSDKPKAKKGKQNASPAPDSEGLTKPGASTAMQSLLQESLFRLAWYYHRYLPDSVMESRVDVMKTFQTNKSIPASTTSESPFLVLGQLHRLRSISGLEHYDWSARPDGHSTIYHILKDQLVTPHPVLRSAAMYIVKRFLSRSVIFEHDPAEVDIWLSSIPSVSGSLGASDRDEPSLMEDLDAFVGFLDDEILRARTMSHVFLEDNLQVCQQIDEAEPSTLAPVAEVYSTSEWPSPLLFAIVGVLRRLVTQRKPAEPSSGKNIPPLPRNLIAVFTYLRSVVIGLAGKQPDMRYTRHLAHLLQSFVRDASSQPQEEEFWESANREVSILTRSLSYTVEEEKVPDTLDVDLESVLNPEKLLARSIKLQTATFIDLLRRNVVPVTLPVVGLMSGLLAPLPQSQDAMRELLLHVTSPDTLWAILRQDDDVGTVVRQSASFDWVYTQSGISNLENGDDIKILAELFVNAAKRSEACAKRNLNMMLVRSGDQSPRDDSGTANVVLRAALQIVSQVLPELPVVLGNAMKGHLFSSEVILNACTSSYSTQRGLSSTLAQMFHKNSDDDRKVAQDICAYWVAELRQRRDVAEICPEIAKWVPFMPIPQLQFCLDAVLPTLVGSPDVPNHHQVSLLEEALSTLSSNFPDALPTCLAPRINSLIQLNLRFKGNDVISSVLNHLAEQALPLCYGIIGQAPPKISRSTIKDAGLRWANRRHAVFASAEVADVDDWTKLGRSVAIAVLYQSPQARIRFSRWIAKNAPFVDSQDNLPVVRAFLDAWQVTDTPLDKEFLSGVAPVERRFSVFVGLLLKTAIPPDIKEAAAHSILSLVRLLPRNNSELKGILKTVIDEASPSSVFGTDLLDLLEVYAKELPEWRGSSGPIMAAIDASLKYVAHRLGGREALQKRTINTLGCLGRLLQHVTGVNPAVAEPTMAAIIHHRLSSVDTIRLAVPLSKTVAWKPVSVNRMIQSLVQHQEFIKYASASSSREPIIELLNHLFKTHPGNTCQQSHIVPLIQVYFGTQSHADRQLLSIFHLFERQTRISVMSLFSKWSARPEVVSGGAYEALLSLDSRMIQETYTNFPHRRGSNVQNLKPYYGCREDLYDPLFVISLLGAVVAEGSIESALAWSEVCRTNAISVSVCALSAKDPGLRGLAIATLTAVWSALENASFPERKAVLHLLTVLRHFIEPPKTRTTPETPRLPTPVTLLLAHALSSIFRPAWAFYPRVMKFLLSRPTFPQEHFPMFFELFFDSSDKSTEHRQFILQFVADSMNSVLDWDVLKRRQMWSLMATLFQESRNDPPTRLVVLLKLTTNRRAVTSLIARQSPLNWIENQMGYVLPGEVEPWLMVIENVWTMADRRSLSPQLIKAQKALLCRCLGVLLRCKGSLKTLRDVTRVISRVAGHGECGGADLAPLLDLCISWLETIEQTNKLVSFKSTFTFQPASQLVLPHNRLPSPENVISHQASSPDGPENDNSDQHWGAIVETLWRLSMSVNDTREVAKAWDELTPRMLLWNFVKRRRYLEGQTEDDGEWARREVLRNLSIRPE